MTDHTAQPPKIPPTDRPDTSNARSARLDRIETLLAQGEIARVRGTMLWGSNYATVVMVHEADLQAMAVYKPQRGERPLWDFPDGTLCYREVVAYLVSKSLGWYLVPPTVLRNGPNGLGSLQLFIEHDPEINYFALSDRFVVQLQQFAIFDYLVNNADRKGGHLLLDSEGKLWGIDHGLTFHTIPKLRTVIWEFAGQPIGGDLLRAVQCLREQLETGDSDLRCRIDTMLSSSEVNALRRRVKHLMEGRHFPNPGPGPNHPWPPI
jgi:uncharacterized repeat protein (TIGR03843 family)